MKNMLHRQIPLQISSAQIKHLKSLNLKIIRHLEEGFALRLNILDDLQGALSEIVQAQPDLVQVLRTIKTSGTYYYVLLSHKDNEILNLPWNIAVDPVSEKQLGSIQQLLISKCLTGYFRTEGKTDLLLPPPLKILIMISSPEDADYKNRLSYEDEEFLILKAFQPLLQTGLVQIDFTDDGSLEALTRKIKTNKYHILHYSGHAIFKNNSGHLILEKPVNLKTAQIEAADFADALNCNSEYRIPVVVLSSCQTAKGSSEAGIRGVTNHLLRVGIPAVVSMGMSIRDRYAAHFSAQFYGQLAQKQNILSAFQFAGDSLKTFEFNEQAKAGITNPVPLQWIIPNLYRSSDIHDLVDWDQLQENLQFSSYRFIFERDRLLLKHEKNYLFIGRRKDKAQILPRLFDKAPIMLKGQGGVGKTAMAEHFVQRLIAAYGNSYPFLFNENTKSINDILKILEKHLQEQGKIYQTELNTLEKGMEKIQYLMTRVAECCEPVFIFDNLESFQIRPNESFAPEYQDIKDIIEYLCLIRKYYVILTGRYTIPDLDHITYFDLNQVGINDFWKKCHYLELGKIAEYIHKNRLEKDLQESLQSKQLKFFDIVALLHQTFGGNYRGLELFNELYKKDPNKITGTLDTLENCRQKFQKESEQVRMEMGRDLVFSELLDLLTPDQRSLLELMSHFRVPVQKFAFQLQLSGKKDYETFHDTLLQLHDLTLLEISLDTETETVYYYATPIVKDLLSSKREGVSPLPFTQEKAGIYYYYNYYNLGSTLTDLEEAFYHFLQAVRKDKVNEIGDYLSSFYYYYSLYQNAFFYAEQAYQLLKGDTGHSILNRLGLIKLKWSEYDCALSFFQKALSGYQEIGDKSGEGTTLNNISQIYDARGDYDTALTYLERSLKIRQEIGDKSGEGTTLNNMATTAYARGDYDTALTYLERSLKISQEIGDKRGMTATLHNMATIAYENKDYKKDLEYTSLAYTLAEETRNANGLFHVGLRYGQILCTLNQHEKGIQILKTSYAVGKQAGFPGIKSLATLIEQLENSRMDE